MIDNATRLLVSGTIYNDPKYKPMVDAGFCVLKNSGLVNDIPDYARVLIIEMFISMYERISPDIEKSLKELMVMN